MNIYYLSAFLIYFVILLMIGLFARKRHMTSEDFIMGNRSLSFWLVALTAHASDMSAWLFMGLPMVVFLLGISQASIAAGLIIGMYVNWQFVAPRLRTMTENYNCYTLPSFFENRFQDNSGIIRSVSAIILVTFMTHYLSAGMIGMGILLESLFGFNYYLGLIFALCIVVTYTFVGGFVAVAWTDLFQGIFLLLMIILVPLMAVMNLGGIQQIVEVLSQKNNGEIPVSIDDSMGVLTMLLLAVSWGAGYFGMPHITTKFMSIKNPSELNKSKWIGISWQVIALSGAVAVGVIARVFFAGGIEDPQMIFVDMVQAIFHPFIAGFILCAVLAAGMSTMNSQILVCASVISEDLYPSIMKRCTSAMKLKTSQCSVVGISLVAMLFSLNKSTLIMDTVSYSWAGLGSSFGPLVLLSLYAKKINRYGAIAGILTGGGVVMIWPRLNSLLIEYSIPPMIPGFIVSLASIFVVSFFTREDTEELQKEYVKINRN